MDLVGGAAGGTGSGADSISGYSSEPPYRIGWSEAVRQMPSAGRARMRWSGAVGLGCGGFLLLGIPAMVVTLGIRAASGEDLGRDAPLLFVWPIPIVLALLLIWSGIRSVRVLRRLPEGPLPLVGPWLAEARDGELVWPAQFAHDEQRWPIGEVSVGVEPWQEPLRSKAVADRVPRQDGGRALVIARHGGRTSRFPESWLAESVDTAAAELIRRGATPRDAAQR